MKKAGILTLAGLLLPLMGSGSVLAQDGSSRRVRKIELNLDGDFVITGNVEKPQVQYFIGREKIRDATPLDLEESFVKEIVKAVEKEPF